MHIPDTSPLTPDQKAHLHGLLSGITAAQSQWLAGFLAGLQSSAPGLGIMPPPAASGPALTILFGSESGNAAGLAQEARRAAVQRGFTASVQDMTGFSPADLAKQRFLLIITSTWGDGEPPVNAVDFHAALLSDQAPRLEELRFAVCSLGDSSYERFCQTGKDMDRRLEELGAVRMHPRADCDVDFEKPFRGWLDGVLSSLQPFLDAGMPVAGGLATGVSSTPPASAFGKSNPFHAALREKVLLSGRGSAKEVWHLEFSLGASGLRYEPGDSLAVIPTNSPETVEALLRAGNFRQASVTSPNGQPVPLFDLLQESYDITTVSKPLLTKFNAIARSPKLELLLADDVALKAYLHGRHIVDLLEDYPVPGLTASEFLGILRKLPPRLYSIASSQRARPDEVHLTVAAVRFESHGRQRKGVASTCLADMVEVGTTAPVYVVPNKHFKLPADPATPVIMVGPGTGVAPFRAFVEERRALGAKGKSWLFFGDQHYTTDFLYQLEWQEALKDGSLTRLEVAFSRDQKAKIYVQHRLEEHGAELWRWIGEGAVLYVCGNASHMAPDVHDAFVRIAERHGHLPRPEAESFMEELRRTKRYLRDVY